MYIYIFIHIFIIITIIIIIIMYICILYNMKAIVPENIVIYCHLKLLQTHKRPAPCIFLLVVLGNMLKRQSHYMFPAKWSDQDYTSPS